MSIIDGFFDSKFPILGCDNVVIKVWLGLAPRKNHDVRFGKDVLP